MTELIISVSGLRGIVGENLTPDVACRYASAFAGTCPPGSLVLARDGRTTGPMLRDAVASALCASGREVIDVGVAATPTVGVFLRSVGAVGAVQISASHNPPPYNGIKLFGRDGRVIGAQAGLTVRQAFERGTCHWVPFDQIGPVHRVADPHAEHLQAVLQTVDVAAIRSQRFRVLLDSNHGAGALLGVRLLEELGCDVTTLGAIPDGLFAHPPEPTAENLTAAAQRTANLGCDVGFCQDPDADRLALIDAEGRYIGEEYTVALCVMGRLAEQPGPVVVNCATSGMTAWLAQRAGVACMRSAVGEANVAETMITQQAIYGGEGNGGPIDPRVGFVRDSFVGMAQVLHLMAARQQSIAQLVGQLPELAIHKTKTTVQSSKLPQVFNRLIETFKDAKPDRQDGLRLDFDGAWLLVRGSNTEPIVRLIAEADTAADAKQLCDRAASVVEEVSRAT